MGRLLKALTAIVFATTVSAAAAQEPRTIEDELAAYSRNPMSPELQGKSRDYYVNSRCAGLMEAFRIVTGKDRGDPGKRAVAVFSEMSVIMLERDHLTNGGSRNYSLAEFRNNVEATRNEMATRYVRQIGQHGLAEGSAIKQDVEFCKDELPVANAVVKAAGRGR